MNGKYTAKGLYQSKNYMDEAFENDMNTSNKENVKMQFR